MSGKPEQTEQSFWAKIAHGPAYACWEWQGGKNPCGYGQVRWRGKRYLAHRVAAWLCGLVDSPVGPKSAEEPTHVLHRCDNPACCNPAHLFSGTHKANMQDMLAKGRRRNPIGALNPRAKLSPAAVAEIKAKYLAGARQVDLAAEYGVVQQSISHVVREVTWA